MAALSYHQPQAPAGPALRPRDGARLVVQTWLFTRLLLVGMALWVGLTTRRSPADMLANWDVQHYFAIARNGYAEPTDIAFFPGWPAVLAVLSLFGVPQLVAGVGLALACSALAAAALYRLGGPVAAVVWLLAPTTVFTFVPYTEAPFCAAAFWAWERARAGRWGAAAGLAAVACTIRVSGLFLLVALIVLALTETGRKAGTPRQRTGWPVLDWLGRRLGLDGLDRRQGGGGLGRRWGIDWPDGRHGGGRLGRRWGIRWLDQRRNPPLGQDRTHGWPSRWPALAWLALPAATLLGYAAYLYALTGDWNAWYRAQTTGWPRSFTWPWVSFQHTWEAATSTAYPAFPEWSWVFRGEIIAMLLGVVVIVACLLLRRWGEASWIGIQVLAFSCSYWFLSVNRAVLLWFPLFILIGEALSGGWNVTRGRRWLRIVLTGLGFAAAAVLLCFWAWLFYTGRWAS